MEILYCKKWWLQKKCPIDILDVKTAKQNHLKGEGYTAVLSRDGIIEYIIEISEKDIFVRFMNENKERYLTYAFNRKSKKDIFLNAAYFYNYNDAIQTEMMVFSFNEEGELYMEKRNLINGDVETRESIVDVSCNWEKYPEFGEYSGLAVLEREKKWN